MLQQNSNKSVALNVMGNYKIDTSRTYDGVMFCYLLVIPLTRQIPYHTFISYASTAILLICFLSRKIAFRNNFILVKNNWQIPKAEIISVVIFYLLAVFLSSIFSRYTTDGIQQLARELAFFFILFVIYDYILSFHQWKNVVLVFFWCSIITEVSLLLSPMVQFYNEANLIDPNRLAGIFYNPSATGLVISVCYPITIGYLQWKKYLKEKNINAWIFLLTILGIVGSIVTISRSTMIAVLFSTIALHYKSIWKLKYKLFFTAIFLMLIMIQWFPFENTMVRLAEMSRIENGLSGREDLWPRAWEIYQEHPVFGTGPSTFKYFVISSNKAGMSRESIENIVSMYEEDETSVIHEPGVFGGVIGNSSHNIWLDQAATMGVLGILTLGSIFIVYWVIAIKYMQFYRTRKIEPYYWVIRSCFIGSLAFFIRAQFEPPGLLKGALSESLLFWLTLILVISVPLSKLNSQYKNNHAK